MHTVRCPVASDAHGSMPTASDAHGIMPTASESDVTKVTVKLGTLRMVEVELSIGLTVGGWQLQSESVSGIPMRDHFGNCNCNFNDTS